MKLKIYGHAIVVYGKNTKDYSDDLKSLGGNWNPTLKLHPYKGWIFRTSDKEKIEKFIFLQVQVKDLGSTEDFLGQDSEVQSPLAQCEWIHDRGDPTKLGTRCTNSEEGFGLCTEHMVHRSIHASRQLKKITLERPVNVGDLMACPMHYRGDHWYYFYQVTKVGKTRADVTMVQKYHEILQNDMEFFVAWVSAKKTGNITNPNGNGNRIYREHTMQITLKDGKGWGKNKMTTGYYDSAAYLYHWDPKYPLQDLFYINYD